MKLMPCPFCGKTETLEVITGAESQHYEAKLAEMQAELDRARELLSNARPHISYLADISETVGKQLAEIDAFLAKTD